MGGKDSNYQIVYRGEVLERFIDGGWVFFQRPKSCGGGFWFGRTYSGLFWLEFERPTSLHDGLKYLVSYNHIYDKALVFDDDFDLT